MAGRNIALASQSGSLVALGWAASRRLARDIRSQHRESRRRQDHAYVTALDRLLRELRETCGPQSIMMEPGVRDVKKVYLDGMRLIAIVILCAGPALAQPALDSVKLDNEFVRVQFLTDQPRTKTPLHRHPLNRVMIYIDPTRLILRYQDGEVERQDWRKGQVAWSPGGRLHTGENLMDSTARVVEVELKKAPSGKPFRTSASDPLKVNANNVRVEFENEYVRVLRCKYLANLREPLHEHLSENRLTVALDDVELKVTTQGGEDRTTKLAAGQASWSTGPVIHGAEANRAVELIVIELK